MVESTRSKQDNIALNINQESHTSRDYTAVVASFVINLVLTGALLSYGIFFKPLSAEFGWTREVTSGAFSLSLLLQGVWGIVAGRVCDRFGPRLILTFCCALSGLGYVLMSQVSSSVQFYLIYGVMLSTSGAIWIALITTITKIFIRRRGLVIGIIASGLGLGTVIMPPLANKLITAYSWRTSFVIIGLIMLVICVTAAQFVKRHSNKTKGDNHTAAAIKTGNPNPPLHGLSVREAISTRPLWIISIISFATYFCIQGIFVHIVPYATDMGLSAASAAGIMSIIGAANIVGRILIGASIDRVGNRWTLFTAVSLMMIAFVWLLFTGERIWGLYPFAVMFALSCGVGLIQAPIIAEFFGMKAHGTVFGIVNFATNIGGAIGALVTGRIFDVTGDYRWAFITCIILSAVNIVLSLTLKSSRKMEPVIK